MLNRGKVAQVIKDVKFLSSGSKSAWLMENSMSDALIWFLVIAAGLVLLFLAFSVFAWLVAGAVHLFEWASESDFIGVAIYFALWIFALPFMLISSIIIGVFVLKKEKEVNDQRSINSWKKRDLDAKRSPPTDPYERIKWANRLPPYDE